MVRQQKISPGQKDYTNSNQTNILNIRERPPKQTTRTMIQTCKFNQDVREVNVYCTRLQAHLLSSRAYKTMQLTCFAMVVNALARLLKNK